MGFRETPTGHSDPQHADVAAPKADIAVISDLVRIGGEAIREISQVLKDNDALPLRDILLLDELERAGDQGLRTSQLAARLGMTTSRLAYRLNSLEKEEMLARRPHSDDGRGVIVTITDRGLAEHARGLELLSEIDRLNGGVFGTTRTAAATAAHAVLLGDQAASQPGEPSVSEVSAFAQLCLERLTADESAEAMFRHLAREASRVLPIEWAMLLAPTDEGLLVTAIFHTDQWPKMSAGGLLPYGTSSPATDAFRAGHPIMMSSFQELDDRYPIVASVYSSLGLGIEHHFSIPLVGAGGPIGALSGTGLEPLAYGDASRSVLEVFARTLSLRIESGTSDAGNHPSSDPGLPPKVIALEPIDRAFASGIMWGIAPEEAAQHLGLDAGESAAVMARIADAVGGDDTDTAVEMLRQIALRDGAGN